VLAIRHSRWWLALVGGLVAAAASATQVITEPFLGVQLIHQTETSPRPLNIYVAEIDLSAPGLRFQVTPVGPDPRPIDTNTGYSGQPMETIRQTTRQYVDSLGAQIGINADFYDWQTINGVNWANNRGLAASNGTAYSPWEGSQDPDFRDALNILQNNQAQFVKRALSLPTGYETLPTTTLYNTMTGSNRILQNNVNVAPTSCAHCAIDPQTAVGLTANNAKLILMVVDGRQTGFSEGLNLVEMADWMKNYFGATNAVNLDGGGSATMVMNLYNDAFAGQVLNSPSDGSERSVGTNLAVFALPNGDYNQNGTLDAPDYVVWRKSVGGQLAFDAWRSSFGNAAGSGSSFSTESDVPEPASITIAIFVCGFLALPILLPRRR
jgi:exopolysaccharide biosynthesis protein